MSPHIPGPWGGEVCVRGEGPGSEGEAGQFLAPGEGMAKAPVTADAVLG